MLDPTPTAQFLASLADTDMMVRSVLRAMRRRCARDAGMTLVEVMITVTILVIVLLATFALLDKGRQTATKEDQRSAAVREAQSGLQRMAKELRAAYQVNNLTSNSITLIIRCRAGETCAGAAGADPGRKLVRYVCTTSCQRGESTTLSNGVCCATPAVDQPVIARVLNQNQPNGSGWACPYTAESDAPGPIFTYYVRQAFGDPPSLEAECSPTAPNAVKIAISVPAGGEKTSPTHAYQRAITLRDAVYLRNLDL